MEPQSREREALDAIETYQAEGQKYAELVALETRLEDERPILKQQAVLRVMEADNPLTNKPHSASSAEAVVESDAIYMEYRRRQRVVVLDKNTALTTLTAARLRAELGIAMIHTTAGVPA